jgi:hypothetical protein
MTKATPFLQVQGEHIVRDGKPIVLKGAALGGWSESSSPPSPDPHPLSPSFVVLLLS